MIFNFYKNGSIWKYQKSAKKSICARLSALMLSFIYFLTFILDCNFTAFAEATNKDFNVYTYMADTILSKDSLAGKRFDFYYNEADSMAQIWNESMTDDFINSVVAWESLNVALEPSEVFDKAIDARGYYMTVILSMMKATYSLESPLNMLDYSCVKDASKIYNRFCKFSKEYYDLDIEQFLDNKEFSELGKKSIGEVQEEFLKREGYLSVGQDASNILKALDLWEKPSEYLEHFIQYCNVFQTSKEWKECLQKMYEKCDKSNLPLTNALQILVDASQNLDNAVFQIAFDAVEETGVHFMGKAIDGLMDTLLGKVTIGIDLGKVIGQSLNDILFGTDEVVESFYVIRAYCQTMDLFKSVFNDVQKDYLKNRTPDNAKRFLAYMEMYFTVLNIGNEFGQDFSNEMYTGGIVNVLWRSQDEYNKITAQNEFFVRYTKEAYDYITIAWLNDLYNDADVENNLELFEVYADILKNKAGIYMPVSRVQFEQDTVEWGFLDFDYKGYDCFAYPESATCKELVYASSDPSIAEITNNGKVKVRGVGNCIITATAVDNEDITDTLNVTVIMEGGADSTKREAIAPIDPPAPKGVRINRVNFPDDFFRQYVGDNYDKDGNNYLSDEEIANICYISFSWEDNLRSLEGIKYFTSLQELTCIYSGVKNLDLSDCTSLKSLNCNNNDLTNLDVSGCIALTDLECNYNHLATLDVNDCAALINLSCCANDLTSLDVSNCVELKSLSCSDNNLTSLDVSNCVALTSLSCGTDNLTSLDVSNCVELKSLSCSDNNLTSLDVSDCVALTSLSCGTNNLTSLDVGNCMALTSLSCSNSGIEYLDVKDHPTLVSIECSHDTKLKNLYADNCLALQRISCYDGVLSHLNVSGCTALKDLSCYSNELIALDVTGCVALEELSCERNALTNLSVKNCSALTTVYCSHNNLTILEVSGCSVLIDLWCDDNKLANLDLTGCTRMKTLKCDYNELTSLDLSDGIALELLDCFNNNLKALDVNSCINLKSLNCYNNDLSNLNFGSCKSLTSLNCSGNKPLKQLDASGLAMLTDITCGNGSGAFYEAGYLTDLNLSQCSSLINLFCDDNELENLDISDCTFLQNLYCSRNSLTSLDVSKCSNLHKLSCSGNNIISLDLSKCKELVIVDCGNTKLNSLNVSGCVTLEQLNCTYSNLTTLDVSDCVALENLYCYNNNLTRIDLSGCISLKIIQLYDNALTSIDVSTCTALEKLWVGRLIFPIPLTSEYSLDNLTQYGFNPLKASEWHGATYNLETNTLSNFTSDTVTYSYDCGNDCIAQFTLSRKDTSDKKVTVTFPESVSVTTTLDEIVHNGDEINTGDKLCITVNIPDGKKLASLTVNGTAFANGDFYTVGTDNIVILITFDDITKPPAEKIIITIPENVTVTRGGTALTNGTDITTGDVLTITANTPSGYSLSSLTVNNRSFTNGGTYTVGNENVVIAVSFKKNSSSGGSSGGGGSSGSSYRTVSIPENVVVTRNGAKLDDGDRIYNSDELRIEAVVPDGKTLSSLTVNGTEFKTGDTYTVGSGNVIISVSFEDATVEPSVNKVTITIPSNVIVVCNSKIVTNGSELNEGDKIIITAFAPADHKLNSLTVNGNVITSGSTYTVDKENVIITANFEEIIPEDTNAPFILSDPDKKGWNVISEVLSQTTDKTIQINMNGSTVLPTGVLQTIQGNGNKILLKMDEKVSWSIDGDDVEKADRDIDLKVTLNTTNIPEESVKKFVGTREYLTLSIEHSGELGFKALLAIDVGTQYTDEKAALYWYDNNEFKSEKESDVIYGLAIFEFTHASDWVIAFGEDDSSKGDTSDPGTSTSKPDVTLPSDTSGSDNTGKDDSSTSNSDNKNNDDENSPNTGVSRISLHAFLALIAAATMCLFGRRQKNSDH